MDVLSWGRVLAGPVSHKNQRFSPFGSGRRPIALKKEQLQYIVPVPGEPSGPLE